MITIDTDTTWSEDKDYSGEDILITNNAVLTIDSHAAGDKQIVIKCRNLTVDAGAKISGDGKGYLYGQGPGRGEDGMDGGGGGYGGHGGDGYDPGYGGESYGDKKLAGQCGSGGGKSTYWNSNGQNGGGCFCLQVDNLTINGSVSANGNNGVSRSAGGSGGGIHIYARTIKGSGNISADGGAGVGGGGHGGGGRIAIYYRNSCAISNITANKGGNGAGNGTIFCLKCPGGSISDSDIKWYKCQSWGEGSSHGGDISENEIVSNGLENIFDNITDEERVSGKTEYRKIYVKLDKETALSNVKLWVDQFTLNPDDEISICASGTNEDTQAEAKNYSYSSPNSFENSLDLGNIYPSGYRPIWIKRAVQPNSRPYHFNTFRLGIGF